MDSNNGDGRGVLVTGCSSGIGRATALHLAGLGFTVYATVRKERDAHALRELEIERLVPICPLDLTDLGNLPRLVEFIATDLARRGQAGLYGLVQNAGGGGVAPLELVDLEIFKLELSARVAGTVGLAQACLPLLRRAEGGRIIWITTPAIIPTPYVASIHACDFAVNCIARTFEMELKPWKIANIQVRCGGIKTAKGLRTTAEVETILNHPKANLYTERLRHWGQEMAEFDTQRTEPGRVAELVARALLARNPRRRYSIGHMAGAAALLEALPQPWADAILKMRF
jgi:NAD(P)-dependent dehydrogenase (short-subunit alcohol dehydrogenase family)